MSTSAQAIPGLIELGRKNLPDGDVGIDSNGNGHNGTKTNIEPGVGQSHLSGLHK